MIILNLKNKKGFTLLEALVAISILMVAVVAPITIAQKGLSSSVYVKNQMIASYLAQDAIEYIKNKRDEVTINQVPAENEVPGWVSLTIFADCKTASGCQIDTIKKRSDVVTDDIRPFNENTHLRIDSNGFYQYSSGATETNFTRQIVMTPQAVNVNGASVEDQYLITVTVNWGVTDEQVVVQSLIFNY